MHHPWFTPLCLLAATSSACVVEDAADVDSSVEQDIGEATCASATPDLIVKLSLNPGEVPPPVSGGITSPATYSNPACRKAYVVELRNNPFDRTRANIPMEVVYAGPRVTILGTPSEQIDTDKATCNSITMRVVRYENGFSLPGQRPPPPLILDDVTTRASFISFGPPPLPTLPETGICLAPASIPLTPTPPGLGQRVALQVIRNGTVTMPVRLKARP
jgi:hypothetical protein